ncbi:hypothetical protein RSK20926_14124 [Roseobacter sp. SK209-2-6]|uniref:Hint domain-containing protein n=1 Tax=Roseobacter sp. SK209-2-6 TaxID=388739 RepID=UPI0000F3D62B|nr:Hint domain-containing protein [Roseobacter sp. SK209-2-6]EBA15774.1 hypothetical protein RSK20926_14124 [Roseobacter sp. SK209-2-6]
MKTGFGGTFVISWTQTEIDGFQAAPLETLKVGATWSWRGEALRVDGPAELLRLEMPDGKSDLRQRAARSVRRLVGDALGEAKVPAQPMPHASLPDTSFVITDGVQSYTVTLIETGPEQTSLLMFVDEFPPSRREMWVVHHSLGEGLRHRDDLHNPAEKGVICFNSGTAIATPGGAQLIEDLRVGDEVLTRDCGAQPIAWIGTKRISGARLYVTPSLRPIRIKTGALGGAPGEQDLLVSPQHKMLLTGTDAQLLFNTDEVLVAAEDLVNGTTVFRDTFVREVTYYHLLLDRHQLIWANGMQSESFHPASASLPALEVQDRIRLEQLLPGLERDPLRYGAYARRNLNPSEAAILQHEAA